MKNEIQSMSIPKIKRMLKLRFWSMFLSVLFTVMTVAFSFGKQVMHWTWAGFFPAAVACVALAVLSCVGYLLLNNKLASGGL